VQGDPISTGARRERGCDSHPLPQHAEATEARRERGCNSHPLPQHAEDEAQTHTALARGAAPRLCDLHLLPCQPNRAIQPPRGRLVSAELLLLLVNVEACLRAKSHGMVRGSAACTRHGSRAQSQACKRAHSSALRTLCPAACSNHRRQRPGSQRSLHARHARPKTPPPRPSLAEAH
jgi:hypothetical protein